MIGIYAWLAGVHWGRVGTWALVIVTLFLAISTWRVSRAAIKTLEQNNRLIESEERHHQENLRPLCVFSHTGNLHNILNRKKRNNINIIIINSDIENKGNGVAKSVKIIFRLGSPRCEGCLQLGPLAAGSKYFNGIEQQYSEILPLELSSIEGEENALTGLFLYKDWVIYIEYEDIFNKKFYTIYVKNDNTADIEFSSDQLPSLKDDNILERLAAEIR